MGRKRIFIAVVCCVALLAFAAVSRAQRAAAPEDDVAKALDSLKARISALQDLQDRAQGDNAQKFNQILQNQDKILRELDVIKVRISIRS